MLKMSIFFSKMSRESRALKQIKTRASALALLVLASLATANMPLVANGSSQPIDAYNEQLIDSFQQNLSVLAVNVTAVEQCGTNGSGPLYNAAGVSNTGYWYEAGISWNWPRYLSPFSIAPGFYANYEVFSSNGSSLRVGGTGPLLDHLNDISNGDLILLRLSFSNNLVEMYVHDWTSNSSDQFSYSAFGASEFVGETGGPADSNGFLTGLMTEQYYSTPYYGDKLTATYSWSSPVSSAWMQIDEFSYPNRSDIPINQYNSYIYNDPTLFQNLSSNGAFETSNAYEFRTGGLSTGQTCAPAVASLFPVSPNLLWYTVPFFVVAIAVALIFWLKKRSSDEQIFYPPPRPDPFGPPPTNHA
jgi:hypothetical protein